MFGERSGSAGANTVMAWRAETKVKCIEGSSAAAGVPAVGLRRVIVAVSAADIVQQFGSGGGALCFSAAW